MHVLIGGRHQIQGAEPPWIDETYVKPAICLQNDMLMAHKVHTFGAHDPYATGHTKMKQDTVIAIQTDEDVFAAPPQGHNLSSFRATRKSFWNRPTQGITPHNNASERLPFKCGTEFAQNGFDFGKLWHLCA
ncbi:hypothetical protein AA101099_0962 [Neoasaia chiangmaiensis NBRC 101099]|nr:hypothetical protein AA101099_0962 [Neoasaia chiangmaiensis NBRC 101099]GEN15201.1 hypothetical protein NCH01_16320 [Neoasaia chiangmaiensis]